jgi:hypothetical protein
MAPLHTCRNQGRLARQRLLWPASTAGETSASPKTGDGVPPAGTCPAGQLDRVRADSGSSA